MGGKCRGGEERSNKRARDPGFHSEDDHTKNEPPMTRKLMGPEADRGLGEEMGHEFIDEMAQIGLLIGADP